MNAFFQELVHTGIYKRSQGRITRQVTFAALAIIVAMGLWRLSLTLGTWALAKEMPGIEFWLPGALLAVGLWIPYRTVNVPGVADFLIAVEAEINKVSWPTRGELVRASLVVLFTIFSLALTLLAFDTIWKFLFTLLGI